MKNVEIYTDGSCHGNPGPGGWGAILKYKNHTQDISGGCRNTTNNQMELTAVIEAFKLLKEPCSVTVYTDSQYVVNAINNKWIDKWVQQNFRTNCGERVNASLWRELIKVTAPHTCKFVWIRGHNGNVMNEKCDKLANEACNLCSYLVDSGNVPRF